MNSRLIRYITGTLNLGFVNPVDEGLMVLVALSGVMGYLGNEYITKELPVVGIPLNVLIYWLIICSSVHLSLATVAKIATRGRLSDFFKDSIQLVYVNLGFILLVFTKNLPVVVEQPKYIFFAWAVLQCRLTVG